MLDYVSLIFQMIAYDDSYTLNLVLFIPFIPIPIPIPFLLSLILILFNIHFIVES